MRFTWLRVPVFVPLAFTAIACGGGDGGGCGTCPLGPAVERVELSGGVALIEVGQTTQFVARGYDASGREIAGLTAVWTSSRDTVASVAGGLVTALTAGTARITASVSGIPASAEVTVTEIPAVTVQIGRDSVMVRNQYTTTVTAQAFAASGAPIPRRRISWRSSNQAVFRVQSAGPQAVQISGNLRGTALLIATMDQVADTVPVTVYRERTARVVISPPYIQLEAGSALRPGLLAFDAAGDTVYAALFSERMQDTSVAAFAFGEVRARAAGVTRLIVQATTGESVIRPDSAADTATVAVLGPRSILSTAWARGVPVAELRAGDTVSVPLAIDLSRVGTAGDLGALQADLDFPSALLSFAGARTEPGSSLEVHAVQPGTLRIGYASTHPHADARFIVATLTFRVTGATGRRGELRLVHTVAPRSTDFQMYAGLVVPAGRFFIVP